MTATVCAHKRPIIAALPIITMTVIIILLGLQKAKILYCSTMIPTVMLPHSNMTMQCITM